MRHFWILEHRVAITARELYDLVRRAGWHWPFRIVVRRSEYVGRMIDDDFLGDLSLEGKAIGDLEDGVVFAEKDRKAPPIWRRGRNILKNWEALDPENGYLSDEALRELATAYLAEQGIRVGRRSVWWNPALERWIGERLPESKMEVGYLTTSSKQIRRISDGMKFQLG